MYDFRFRVILAMLAALLLNMSGSELAFSQSAQHRETDLDFTTRATQQATNMSARVAELEKRLSQSSSSTGQAASGSPERLRHKDRAATSTDADRERLQNELGSLKSEIRKEQQRMRSQDLDDDKVAREQQQRMQKLDARLRRVETEIVALD